MTVLVVLAAVALGLVVVDRLLVWCELRGWIMWRLTPRPTRNFRGAAGHALLNLDAFFQPQTRHVVEMRIEQAVHREADGQGGDGLPRRRR